MTKTITEKLVLPLEVRQKRLGHDVVDSNGRWVAHCPDKETAELIKVSVMAMLAQT
jgi:hypothetical protein